ncbi:MAG: tRNA (adenosine(37)-N6)-threonylcarbamoyltransferase complex dimerization subunit type 1 TsaB [Flavobacteriales bacterium]|jgi:tRNA threonylcarbamoyladenosine biosynthesis protein TsaB
MILHLETATKICSVALSKNGELFDFIETSSDQFVHGEALTLMIDQLLKRNSIDIESLLAISFSLGPGSYTGLRIGLATAKGLSFGLGIPFIGVSSLESLVSLARAKHPDATIAAAFDARRDEVFLRIQQQNRVLLMDQPLVITEDFDSPSDTLVWVGDANVKLKEMLGSNPQHAFDDEIQPSAIGQITIAFHRFSIGDFDDIDQIKPNYTKAFYSASTKA